MIYVCLINKAGLPEKKMVALVKEEHVHADGGMSAIKVTASEMDLYEEDLKTQLDGFCIDSVNVNVG